MRAKSCIRSIFVPFGIIFAAWATLVHRLGCHWHVALLGFIVLEIALDGEALDFGVLDGPRVGHLEAEFE